MVIESEVPFVDDFLPIYDVWSQHSVVITAPPAEVYEAARTVDLGSSRITRLLFRLRGLPASDITLDGLARIRFKPLLEQPPVGFVLGIVGQFWSPTGHLMDFDPKAFRELTPPDHAKAIWSFDVAPLSENTTELRTVTRVACPDPASRRRFRLYWTFIGPFSGLIRRELLRVVKRRCESGRRTGSV